MLLLTMPSNVLPSHLKQTFPPIIFTEGDGIESSLPFKVFSTLPVVQMHVRSFRVWDDPLFAFDIQNFGETKDLSTPFLESSIC